jgi:putative methyltransferase (TIGR04325 family)
VIKSAKQFLRPLKRLRQTIFSPPQLAFRGDYPTWQNASDASTGYDSSIILERCKNALMKVKNGEAAYERDSVLFNKVEYSWPVLAGMLRAAAERHGELAVLDFGGSLGSSYYQNRNFLKCLKSLSWGIVEQPNFVQCGRQNFANDQLQFFSSVEECVAAIQPDLLFASSSLPYLEKPREMIDKWKSHEFRYIIIDRTYFIDGARDRLTVQDVPETIYKASYPAWFFSEQEFLRQFEPEYELVADFLSYLNAAQYLRDTPATEKGFIFRRRTPA